MSNYEKGLLNQVIEKVKLDIQLEIDKKQIAEWLDAVIYFLSDHASSELFNILYRIQDNLLFGNEIME